MLPAACITRPATLDSFSPSAWLALGYVSLFSMLVGFIFWYSGLAKGGIAEVGQLQLLQPFFALLLSALFLGEKISLLMIAITAGIILCVAGSRRYSARHRP